MRPCAHVHPSRWHRSRIDPRQYLVERGLPHRAQSTGAVVNRVRGRTAEHPSHMRSPFLLAFTRRAPSKQQQYRLPSQQPVDGSLQSTPVALSRLLGSPPPGGSAAGARRARASHHAKGCCSAEHWMPSNPHADSAMAPVIAAVAIPIVPRSEMILEIEGWVSHLIRSLLFCFWLFCA